MSSVESKYLKNLKKVEAREIDNMLMSFLSYFMTLQLIRVDKFITENQKIGIKLLTAVICFVMEITMKNYLKI